MPEQKPHGHVAHIGGVFIYSENPGKLAEWYQEHLGIEYTYAEAYNTSYAQFYYREDQRPEVRASTVLSVLKAKNEIVSEGKRFMINYRVYDLEKAVVSLRSKGIEVKGPEEYPEGKFAWVKDSEGNEIELWEDTTLQKID